MRALITNDDGVGSAGLRALVRAALESGLDVTVAAPDGERSGSAAALSALEENGRLLLAEHQLDGFPDVPAFGVRASPALIVFVAVRGAFGAIPDLVLSGVNHGPNTGQAVLHSGTVGAGLTAVAHGLPALAVSSLAPRPAGWTSATLVAGRAIGWLRAHGDGAHRGRRPFLLNVNVPDLAPEGLRGLRPATLAHFGAVQARIGERGRGYLTTTFSEVSDEAAPGTDVVLLREGWATATAIEGLTGSTAVDFGTLAWEAETDAAVM